MIKHEKGTKMFATVSIKFETRNAAEIFARDWSRKTLRGHSISSGKEDVVVTIYGVTEEEKTWIDEYILKVKNKELA